MGELESLLKRIIEDNISLRSQVRSLETQAESLLERLAEWEDPTPRGRP
jgi:hypothetical protein